MTGPVAHAPFGGMRYKQADKEKFYGVLFSPEL